MKRGDTRRLVLAAILGGLGAGLSGDLLILVLHATQWLTSGIVEGPDRAGLAGVPGWRRVLGPVLVGLIVGAAWWQLRTRARPIELDRGIRDESAALPVPATTADALLQVIAVGAGASVGREVAPRQIAAALAGRITARLGVHGPARTVVVGAAAAAGLAAVYDAPVTGVVYAVEVIGVAIGVQSVLVAAVASSVAAVTCWPILGARPAYVYPGGVHLHRVDCIAAALLVPTAWLVGTAFRRLNAEVGRHRLRPGPWTAFAIAAAMGLVGALALVWPTLPGNGKAQMQTLLSYPAPALGTLLVLVVLKPLATGGSMLASIAGGVIAPSLATGAALGAAVAVAVGHGASVPSAVVVGAAAVLAVTQRAPVMAAVFAVELTHPGLETGVLVAGVCLTMLLLARAADRPRGGCHTRRLR